MIAFFLLFTATAANATLLTFELESEFSGATPPTGDTPWLTAIFDDDTGNDKTVLLTMEATNLVDDEFITEWYFNFDPELNVDALSFYAVDVVDAQATTILTEADAFRADGVGGDFDILFNFSTSNNGERFGAGETVSYLVTYTAAIDVSSFDFLSDGGNELPTAAHIQGIDPNDDESGWVSVPDASIMYLLGPTLVMLGVFGRRRAR
jgi:hypothetical protein